jgi:NAD(P)-dependent dehydrogenase (short-subunit alcohol dehydrogenase family)
MGKYMAEALLAEGANVVINARTESKLLAFKSDHSKYSKQIAIAAGDISLKETSEAMGSVAIDSWGKVDALINNAGIFVPKPFLEATEEDLDAYYGSGLKGAYFACQNVIPELVKQGGGSIINIGSQWVENPIEATPCSASQVAKGGMHTLTRHLAIEFAKQNIRTNTIAPGIIETPLYDNLMDKETLHSLAKLHPLNKLGNMDDINGWVIHLLSGGDRFVTGQTLFVDGGLTVGKNS